MYWEVYLEFVMHLLFICIYQIKDNDIAAPFQDLFERLPGDVYELCNDELIVLFKDIYIFGHILGNSFECIHGVF